MTAIDIPNSNTRTTYFIGDVQGCDHTLSQLIDTLPNTAHLVFLGDIINRGPDSLQALRRIINLGNRASVILGNHDLHCLAVAADVRPLSPSDTLSEILNAPDSADLINWIRTRPLIYTEPGVIGVHAGILPEWDYATTVALAEETQDALRSADWKTVLKNMYGNKPKRWSADLNAEERQRCIINVFTRLRYLNTETGEMNFSCKVEPDLAPEPLKPWFADPNQLVQETILFGHWSTLDLYLGANRIGLDTGCVWGRMLTALEWPSRQLVQIPNLQKPAIIEMD